MTATLWTLERLQDLVENKAPETIIMDLKRDDYTWSDDGKKELLKDVCAFANTRGGQILIGVDEEEGNASALVGLSIVNIDDRLRQIQQILDASIEPRIGSLHLYHLSLENKRIVIVIDIPNSWNKPHRTNFKGSRRFFVRSATANIEADVTQIRNLFLGGLEQSARIGTWRDERVAFVAGSNSRLGTIDGPTILIHLVPLQNFGGYEKIPIDYNNDASSRLGPPLHFGHSWCYNFDGLLLFSEPRNARSYTQLFRSRIVEFAFKIYCSSSHKQLSLKGIERAILECVPRALQEIAARGVLGDVEVLVTAIGVLGYTHSSSGAFREEPCSDNILRLDGLTLSQNSGSQIPERIRPIFDHLWNCFGYVASLSYDRDGKYLVE